MVVVLRCPILTRIIGLVQRVAGRPRVPERRRGLQPRVIPRSEHSISRADISDNALKVLYRLNKAGYQAFLVGGGVRDLLLGHQPKDFDICTDATPEQIYSLFRNCRLVGRRFRLAHILFGRDVVEVATFRGHHAPEEREGGDDEEEAPASNAGKRHESGLILRDNVYGSIEEDAERRDFSVNALYYNIADFSVWEFANGLEALKARKLELIGDPATRYREDPVRMLRAVRFATKLTMTLSKSAAAPISSLAPLLAQIPPARLFEEFQKLFMAGHAVANYRMLRQFGLFQQMFPQLLPVLTPSANSSDERFIEAAFANTDARVHNDQRITPAFLFAALLWPVVQRRVRDLTQQGGLAFADALNVAMSDALDDQQRTVALPRRFSTIVREIWVMQYRLPKRSGPRAQKLVTDPRFRAAYDFLLVRGAIEGGETAQLAEWWTHYQQVPLEERDTLAATALNTAPAARKPRRRRGGKRGNSKRSGESPE